MTSYIEYNIFLMKQYKWSAFPQGPMQIRFALESLLLRGVCGCHRNVARFTPAEGYNTV